MALEFRLLGDVAVLRDERPIELGGVRSRSLVALLVLNRNHTVATQALADRLWPDEQPLTALKTIQVYISRFRRALGPETSRIASSRAGYALRVADDELDVARFEHLLHAGRNALAAFDSVTGRRSIEAALAIWQGPALADLATEPFARREAERLEEVRLQATEDLNEIRLAAGEAPRIVGELRHAVGEHPERERLWAQLMRALYADGRQAEALAAYHDARRYLSVELGIDPGPSLQELEGAILRQELVDTRSAGRVAATAVDLDPLFGREHDLAAIAERLGHARLVTLTGPGGSGKTRLAAAAVAAAVAAGRAAWFVDASALRESALLAPAIAAVLRIEGSADQRPLDGVAAALADRDALLALDNLEQLDGVGAAVGELLSAAPRVRILATSRFRVGTAGESEMPVPPLALPVNGTPNDVEASPAGALMLARARAIGRLDRLDVAIANDVADLLRRLDGLPLAIELAAARTRILTPAEICQWLDRQGLTAVDAADGDARRSLRQILDWTIGLLSADQSRVLGGVSVTAGFDVELAYVLVPDADIIGSIDSLVSLGLVRPTGQINGASRFRLLQTIRGEVARRLTLDERRQYRGRHAEAMSVLAARLTEQLRGTNRALAVERLDGEADNFRLALDWFDETDPKRGLELWWSLNRFWRSRHRHREGIARFERTAALAPEPTIQLSRATSRYAGLNFELGPSTASRELNLRALALAREVGDPESEVEALTGVVMVAVAEADLAGAEAAAHQASEIAASVDDPRVRASAAQAEVFATMANRGANSDEMRDSLIRATDAAVDAGNLDLELSTRGNLAVVQLYRGDFRAAIDTAERAVDLARQLDHQLLSWCLGTLSSALAETGQIDRAVSGLTEAAADVAILAVPDRVVDVLGAGASVALAKNNPLLAARLRGAIGRMEVLGAIPQPDDMALVEHVMTRVRERATPQDVELALRQGATSDPVELLQALPDLLTAHGVPRGPK